MQHNGTTWFVEPDKACGSSPVIYDNLRQLHISDCGPGVGSGGYRYVDEQNHIISGDATYAPKPGCELFEWTELPGGYVVGQGPSDNDAFLFDPSDKTYRSLIAGNARYVRAYREGDQIAVCAWVPSGNTSRSEFLWATVQEILAFPKRTTAKVAPPPTPVKPVVRIGRRTAFGPFLFLKDTPYSGPPGNSHIVVEQAQPVLRVAGPDWAYVSGDSDGDPASIEAAIRRARGVTSRPVLAYVPKAAFGALPTRADIQGIECYVWGDESDDEWLARRSAAIKKCGRAALIAQVYDNRDPSKPNLRRVPGLVSILARDHANVEAIFLFSAGPGRGSGWDDHPEVHAQWREVFAGITGPLVPDSEIPNPEPPKVPELPDEPVLPPGDNTPEPGNDPPFEYPYGQAYRPDKPIGGNAVADAFKAVWRFIAKTNWRKVDFRFWR